MKSKKTPNTGRARNTSTANRTLSYSALQNRNSTSSLFNNTSSILQEHNHLFGTKSFGVHVGDADTHFKKTLRKYNDLRYLENTTKWIQRRFSKGKLQTEFKRASGDFRSRSNEEKHRTAKEDKEDAKTEEKMAGEEEFMDMYEEYESLRVDMQEEIYMNNPEEARPPEEEPIEQGEEHEEQEPPLIAAEDDVGEDDFKTLLGKSLEEMKKAVEEIDDEILEEMAAEAEGKLGEIIGKTDAIEHCYDIINKGGIAPPCIKVEICTKTGAPSLAPCAKPAVEKAVCPFAQDNRVLKELEDAELQARETANIIKELKNRVAVLLEKDHMTDSEGRELEEMNKQLIYHMETFEEKTKMIQVLVNMADKVAGPSLPCSIPPPPAVSCRPPLPQPTTPPCARPTGTAALPPCARPTQTAALPPCARPTAALPPPVCVIPVSPCNITQPTPPVCMGGGPCGILPLPPPSAPRPTSPCPPPRDSCNICQLQSQQPPAEPCPPPIAKHKEDMLPKVVICGSTDQHMPKIIICESQQPVKKDQAKKPTAPCAAKLPQPGPGNVPFYTTCVAQRLSESYDMQEKLAADNVDLEGKRYQLQEELLNRDKTVECLQNKICSLQAEMRIIVKENSALNEKLAKVQGKCRPRPDMPCGGPAGGTCPADVENRLQHYSEATASLEKQVELMECDVKRMQEELATVQRERAELERQRQAALAHNCLPCKPGSVPSFGTATTSSSFVCPGGQNYQYQQQPCPPPPCGGGGGGGKQPCKGPCAPNPAEQQLRELREQYDRLQDDYKGKVTEVAVMRAETDKLRSVVRDAESAKKMMEERLEELDKEIRQHRADKNRLLGSKEQLIEQEQQLAVAKQRFREAQDELDELRACIQDQAAQLEDYRNKYLQAQQHVEEQRRQIDVMEMENQRISEQVAMEIQRVKTQFQEKLSELAPLPDILKATQLKLQEEQQLRLMAERNAEALLREVQIYKDKAQVMLSQMEKARSDQMLSSEERMALQSRISGWECKCNEMQASCDRMKTEMVKAKEQALQNEKRLEEKLHELAQLNSQLESVREESARQVARVKDRCETVRRSLQLQVAELERQLAQSRAQARAALRDRDDVRQKMQAQISNLNDNFEEAQLRIRTLQGHVNFLKNSYTTVFGQGQDGNQAAPTEGFDGCDC